MRFEGKLKALLFGMIGLLGLVLIANPGLLHLATELQSGGIVDADRPERPAELVPPTVAALPPAAAEGRGAIVSFVEYEAETARTNGEIIGPDRTFTTLAAEASGRSAVRLAGPGKYVEFKLAERANAVTVRYAIPDTANGAGSDATLDVSVAGSPVGVLNLTSRYSWFYGSNPFTNRPADGNPHHFYAEARVMFGRTLAAGTTVRLQAVEDDAARWYVIDLADFELVAPEKPRPANSLSVTDFGADPSGAKDSLGAFRAAVAAGRQQHRTVWIPRGDFKLPGHLEVDRVTLAGAGPWYSVLRGAGVGVYGRYPPTPSQAVTLQDFAIIGEVTDRDDRAPLSGVGGAMGGGSRLSNLWIQHQKTGVWFDGPMDGVTISGLRILDTTADGINFRRGVSHAVVENSFIRNTGDDGLAMWSHREANHDDAFLRNTVVAPILANGIGIYGGHDITVRGNVVADIVTQGGGIHVGNRFEAVPVSGALTLADNLIVRGGSFDPNWKMGIGAIWFYALDAPMTARITIADTAIVDSGAQALLIKGKGVTGLEFDRLRVDRAKTYLLQLQSPGSATFRNVTATGLLGEPVTGCRPDFRLLDGGGNGGWITRATTQACGR